MEQSSHRPNNRLRYSVSPDNNNGVPTNRFDLPIFPDAQELVSDERNVWLLEALLEALQKYNCLEIPVANNGKRSPWARAFCELHHPTGPWGSNTFLDAPPIDSIQHRNGFEYEILERIFEALRQYQGDSAIHRELLERLENFKEKLHYYDRCIKAEQEAKMAEKKASNEKVARVAAETEVARLEDECTKAQEKAFMTNCENDILIAEKEEAERKVARLEEEQTTDLKAAQSEAGKAAVARLEQSEKRASIEAQSTAAKLAKCNVELKTEREAATEAERLSTAKISRLRADLIAARSEALKAKIAAKKRLSHEAQSSAAKLAECENKLEQLNKEREASQRLATEEIARLKAHLKAARSEGVKEKAALEASAQLAAEEISRLKADLTAARLEVVYEKASVENRAFHEAQSAAAKLAECKNEVEQFKKKQEALAEAARFRTEENHRLKAELKDSEARAFDEAQSAAAKLAVCRSQLQKEQEASKDAAAKISRLKAELLAARCKGAVEKKATVEDVIIASHLGDREKKRASQTRRASLTKAQLSISSEQNQEQKNLNDIQNKSRSRTKLTTNEISPLRKSERNKRKASSMYEDARIAFESAKAAKRTRLSKANKS